ncbi:MAG: hypothetical protein JO132_08430 [Streptosporangiaceae bacterium]|nr:hypothetical protein [Streptosporangiaceae bacterium]
MTGLILLAFLVLLAWFGWTRVRGRITVRLNGNGRQRAIAAAVIFVVVVLLLWTAHHGH